MEMTTTACDDLSGIRLISFKLLKSLGEFPRCPENADVITDFSKVNEGSSIFIFVSHCWIRGSSSSKGWNGRAHPDNEQNEKYVLCCEAIERVWASLAPGMEECYVWFDYSCIDQDSENPAFELKHLDKIMHLSDCVITPIVDNLWSDWHLHLSGNLFIDYKASSWRCANSGYLYRAWCRMEMLYAATIPVRKESLPGGNRYCKFNGGLKFAIQNNRRPHIIYGSREYHSDKNLLFLPPLLHSYFSTYNPLKGNITHRKDLSKIEALMEELKPYIKNDNCEAYSGGFNTNGAREGFGTLIYENGNKYVGHFVNGELHGYGILTYFNGDVYKGNFENNVRSGQGVMIYANGNVYVGPFFANRRDGHGVIMYADGRIYDGDFDSGFLHGYARLYFPDGTYYRGSYKYDEITGVGEKYLPDGSILNGMFENGAFIPENDNPSSPPPVQSIPFPSLNLFGDQM